MEGLIDFTNQGTTRHRGDNVPWRAPPQLLGNFKTHGFGTFGIKRPEVDIHKAPTMVKRDLGTQTIHFVVCATHANHRGAVNTGAENFGSFQIGGHQNKTRQTCCRRVGRDTVGKVSRAGATHNLQAEFFGFRQGYRYHPILE